jgi:hypothetical protein
MSEWHPIETAPVRQIIIVCNPAEGFVPAIAKKVGNQWYNIGATLVGRSAQECWLEPKPTYWMPVPEMPR